MADGTEGRLDRIGQTRHIRAMKSATSIDEARPVAFTGASANRLAGDWFGPADGRPVILAHGGGQTRHAWGAAARRLGAEGWAAVTFDQRGHGESDWIEDGDYSFDSHSGDLRRIADDLTARLSRRPVVIGASLGGVATMLVEGESSEPVFDAVVLVDITPRVEQDGVDRIVGFMASRAREGFGSLDEAADEIARYLPHRKRPRDLKGLSKNLRRHEDGRYRWHWDPRFLEGRFTGEHAHDRMRARLSKAVRAMTCPILLVRGRQSELVSDEMVADFMSLAPHADYADVRAAGHMVAGDSNDLFTAAILDFLKKLS